MRQIIVDRLNAVKLKIKAARKETEILEAIAAEFWSALQSFDNSSTPNSVALECFASNPDSKIDAIKSVRNLFGMTLKDAKDVCDDVWEKSAISNAMRKAAP